jgi:competence protein ComEC
VEDLPFSLIEEIHLTTFQCWLIMICLLALVFMIEYKSIRWLYLAGTCSIILSITQWMHFNESINREQFVVYSVNGLSAYEWMEHGQSYFVGDSAFIQDQERVRFHVRPNRLNSGITRIHAHIPFYKELKEGVSLARWNSNTIVFIQHRNFSLPELAKIDYLVVGKNAINTNLLPVQLKVKKVILDGSNSRWYVNQWRDVSGKKGIAVHAVADEGAFILTK